MLVVTVVIFSAFALGAATDSRVLGVANVLWGVGGLGTLILGIWLALYVDGYEIWDGWIIAAIVLWAIATELGRRAQLAVTPQTAGGAGATDALAALAGRSPAADRDDLQAGGLGVLAAIHPDNVEFPLLLHVLGAMLLVGSLVL